jgi:Fur family ferric uptake transcriptional regulator
MVRKVRNSRFTRQKSLLQGLVSLQEGFFSAVRLHELALKKDSSLGLATVYRFLRDAKRSGLLSEYVCDRKKVYAKGRIGHCHFVCERTGRMIHFDLDDISVLQEKIPGTITSFSLEVKGVCDDCQSK